MVCTESSVNEKSNQQLESKITTVESNENNVENEAKRKDVETQTDLVESKDAWIQTDQSVVALVKQYKMRIEELQREIEGISKKNECLKSRLFSTERFRADNSAVSFYTSFHNNAVLMEIYNYLDPRMCYIIV